MRCVLLFVVYHLVNTMATKQAASEVVVVLQNQFKDKIAESVQRFLSKVDKRRLGDSTMGAASTNLIMSMNRAGNWYAANLERTIKREIKEVALEKKKARVPRAANPALTRKYVLSDPLAIFMGNPSSSRQDVLKRVWEYVNMNGLKDASSPGKVKVDNNLRGILGTGDASGLVGNTEIMKLISPHFIRAASD